MKIKDSVAWSNQEIELQADETSRKFLDFFILWFTQADAHIELQWPLTEDNPILDVAGAMRWGLAIAEELTGYLSMEWIGQMLVLASQHWERGEDMIEQMTIVERRTMEQMAAVKLVELQRSAVDSDQ